MVKILVIDDEPVILDYLESCIADMGLEVSGAVLTSAAALESIAQNKPDLALVDAQLGHETCEAVINECASLGISVIISTGMPDVPACCVGLPVLHKPYSADVLSEAILDSMALQTEFSRTAEGIGTPGE